MTVFVVNNPKVDIAPALQYGELRYINRFFIHGDELESGFEPFPLDWTIPADFKSKMEAAADAFNPDEDYLLIAGDHLQLVAFTAILFTRFRSILVLRYDRKLEGYIPVRVHGGLVPGGGPVLKPNHIGETDHGEDLNQGRTGLVPALRVRILADPDNDDYE